jgi:hypothetical protein
LGKTFQGIVASGAVLAAFLVPLLSHGVEENLGSIESRVIGTMLRLTQISHQQVGHIQSLLESVKLDLQTKSKFYSVGPIEVENIPSAAIEIFECNSVGQSACVFNVESMQLTGIGVVGTVVIDGVGAPIDERTPANLLVDTRIGKIGASDSVVLDFDGNYTGTISVSGEQPQGVEIGVTVGKCLCKDLTVRLIDPKEFDQIRKSQGVPPKNFGSQNPKVTVKTEKIRGKDSLVVEVGAFWEKHILCSVEKAFSKCTGLVDMGVGATDFKLDGQVVIPSKQISKAAVTETGVLVPVTAQGKPVTKVECESRCNEKGVNEGTRTAYASLARFVIEGKTGNLDVDEILIQMFGACPEPPAGLLVGKWDLKVKIDDNKLDFNNSDFDGDGKSNGTDANPYDPKVQ